MQRRRGGFRRRGAAVSGGGFGRRGAEGFSAPFGRRSRSARFAAGLCGGHSAAREFIDDFKTPINKKFFCRGGFGRCGAEGFSAPFRRRGAAVSGAAAAVSARRLFARPFGGAAVSGGCFRARRGGCLRAAAVSGAAARCGRFFRALSAALSLRSVRRRALRRACRRALRRACRGAPELLIFL